MMSTKFFIGYTMMKGRIWRSMMLGFVSAFIVTGCASVGPPTVARDRFDYVTSVSDSWKRQMLLNMLKIRYSDAPIFMDIASVINSYEVSGDVSLEGQLAEVGRGDQLLSLGASGRYSDKPTITYNPLSGDKFARNLMLPIPISAILFLIRSGVQADLVLRVCVNSINDIENAYNGPGRSQEGSPKYHELITAIRESQAAGGMGMRLKTVSDKQTVMMFLRQSTNEATAIPVRKIRELLGLNASGREFSVVYGTYPENDTEIAVLTRSILQVLTDFSSYFEVPTVDLAEGRVYGLRRTPEQERLFPRLLHVHNGPSVPGDAYVSVHYRNQKFWIDDRDQQSKMMFNFILFMFSLTETGSTQAAPIVTVPTR